ncbi:MAG: RNA polymerase sigma factor [Polyangiales bacterium]|nr:RNA polymerase sigma factor [Myxococcales bacterium]MCB9601305.1 RNA polymerase sigma factor [Sandaracinus sp.]
MSSAPAASFEDVADDVLAARATAGDREALEALLRRHAADVFKLCHLVAGETEGPDAAQRTLEKLVLNIDRFEPEKGSFRTWALTVARNVCRDRLRRRKLERTHFRRDGEERVQREPTEQPSPERLALARIEAGEVAKALETLPEGMRSAIVLFHVHGASYEEIAETLDIPKGTVMTWLHRGRARLRAALEPAEVDA